MYSRISFHKLPALSAALVFLSASTVLAQSNAPANSIQLKGALDGRAAGTVQDGRLTSSATGAGTSSYIGRFSYTGKDTGDLATGLSTGSVQLVAANGDVINGLSVGRSGEKTDTPTIGHAVFLVTITGGTGRFQDVTGVITLDYLVDNSTIPAYISITGTLKGTIITPPPAK